LADKQEIVLKVVPLAISSADNILPIAQVLGGDHPDQAWKDLVNHQIEKLPESPDPKGVLALKANVSFAQSMNLHKLPFILYKQTGTGTIRVITGTLDWDKFCKDAGVSADKSH
jgi:hypothetical protein